MLPANKSFSGPGGRSRAPNQSCGLAFFGLSPGFFCPQAIRDIIHSRARSFSRGFSRAGVGLLALAVGRSEPRSNKSVFEFVFFPELLRAPGGIGGDSRVFPQSAHFRQGKSCREDDPKTRGSRRLRLRYFFNSRARLQREDRAGPGMDIFQNASFPAITSSKIPKRFCFALACAERPAPPLGFSRAAVRGEKWAAALSDFPHMCGGAAGRRLASRAALPYR